MSRRIIFALAAFVVWVTITVYGGKLLAGVGPKELGDGLSTGIAWNILGAGLFLWALSVVMGWRDLGLNAAPFGLSFRLSWLPLLIIFAFFVGTVLLGLPPASALLFILLNCLFVGFSEEMMFRGVLFSAFRSRHTIWPSILIVSVLFGAVHSLNVFVTGDLKDALIQSSQAFMTGFIFVALRLRTGSLWPPILLHAAWDAGVFSLSLAVKAAHPAVETAPTAFWAFAPALLLTVPNFLYALYLLRNIHRVRAES